MQSIAKAKEVYEEKEKDFQIHIKELDKLIQESLKDSPHQLEGNCFYHGGYFLRSDWFFIYKRMNLFNLIQDHQIKRMVEIGFNGGHSATLFLSALPKDGELLFFDLFTHLYAKPCYDYLKSQFPQIKNLIAGNSVETMPTYIETHPEEVGSYDCVHVDGCHDLDFVLSDVVAADRLLKKGGILILDDTQAHFMKDIIRNLLERKYTFIYQIPTFVYSHCCLIKLE